MIEKKKKKIIFIQFNAQFFFTFIPGNENNNIVE